MDILCLYMRCDDTAATIIVQFTQPIQVSVQVIAVTSTKSTSFIGISSATIDVCKAFTCIVGLGCWQIFSSFEISHMIFRE